MAKCKECSKEFKTERSLHAHLKAHKLRINEYYQKHFPRRDKFDNELIVFKDKEQYLKTDFNSALNYRRWRKASPKQEVAEYILSKILERIASKDIIYSMCQVELRSLKMPTVQEIIQYFDYSEECEMIGLENKFLYKNVDIIEGSASDNPGLKIYIDTREQKPLVFKNVPTERRTLKFGDYAFSDEKMTCKCYIERKSLADFIGSLRPDNLERFRREIERAGEADAYLIVLIDQDINHALSFDYLRNKHSKERIFKETKVTPQFIMRKVRKLIQEYPFIQFLFVEGRKESVRVIEKVFKSGCIYRKIDLQYAYDIGKL